jgi:hypothetical protein
MFSTFLNGQFTILARATTFPGNFTLKVTIKNTGGAKTGYFVSLIIVNPSALNENSNSTVST